VQLEDNLVVGILVVDNLEVDSLVEDKRMEQEQEHRMEHKELVYHRVVACCKVQHRVVVLVVDKVQHS